MTEKVIRIETNDRPLGVSLERVMRMVPERDKQDPNLKRLLAFRLRVDGEDRLREFLMKRIRAAIACAYTGSFFEFIRDDLKANECQPEK